MLKGSKIVQTHGTMIMTTLVLSNDLWPVDSSDTSFLKTPKRWKLGKNFSSEQGLTFSIL